MVSLFRSRWRVAVFIHIAVRHFHGDDFVVRTKQIILPAGLTPRLLSRDEAAAYCGICPNTFSQYVAKEIVPLKFGRRKLWDINALDEFIGKHRKAVADGGSIDGWLQRLRDAHSV
jgi:hypothetical protein